MNLINQQLLARHQASNLRFEAPFCGRRSLQPGRVSAVQAGATLGTYSIEINRLASQPRQPGLTARSSAR
jgi:hypothetical protein